MTFKDRLQQEHPKHVKRIGSMRDDQPCPCEYGYEENSFCEQVNSCVECWNREIPMSTLDEQAKEQNIQNELIARLKYHLEIGNDPCLTNDEMKVIVKALERNDDYNKGLNDAWELLKKIIEMYSQSTEGAFGTYYNTISEYDRNELLSIMRAFPPQKAFKQLKVYENAQKLCVGDVVETNLDGHEQGVCVGIMNDEKECFVLFKERDCVQHMSVLDVRKTDKHIDIQSIFEQIEN